MTVRAALALATTALAVGLGCASAGADGAAAAAPALRAHAEFASARGAFSVVMPAPVAERRGWEGPVEMVLASSEDNAGAVYEATYFELPEPLGVEEKVGLADRVVRGLSGGPGVRVLDIAEGTTSGEPSLELVLAIGEAQMGTWRLFFVEDRRMFQLSVVGPADGRHESRASGFFASFRLKPSLRASSGLDLASAR